MAILNNKTIVFLSDLKRNNNREWFLDNKKDYQNAKDEFEAFISEMMLGIGEFDPSILHHSPKDCIFRINRDIRFSKDKSPYKTHLGAHITSAAKRSDIHSRAGYYIHVSPGETMLAGGAYCPQGDWLKNIRAGIDENAQELKDIITAPNFKAYFGTMEGEQLKTAPRDYPKDHPEIALLRYKSFLAKHEIADKMVTADTFLPHSIAVFKALHPFDTYLNNYTTPTT